MVSISITGCNSKQNVAVENSAVIALDSNENDTVSQNSDHKILVESFIDYYNKGDADSLIGLLSKDIVTEQKLGDQESKSTDIKSAHTYI